MENIIKIQYIISAIIGLGSSILVAILTGIFQLNIARKNREIANKQFEQSKEEFSIRMQQSQREYAEKIEQLHEEQRNANIAKANDKLQAQTDRFYNELIKEILFYDRLLNELHYLNNIANPSNREFRIKGAYPHIDSNIKDIIGDVTLPQDIAKLLGALRANISLYNATLEQGAVSEILEDSLKRVYNLIDPINTERFENYANAQAGLRKHEIDMANQIVQNKENIS